MSFCQKCGTQLGTESGFCSGCGSSVMGSMPAPPAMHMAPTARATGNSFSIAGIICGGIAFLFLPIILGPAGLVLGAVGKSKGEDKAVLALIVSGLGLVIGMILGAAIGASTY